MPLRRPASTASTATKSVALALAFAGALALAPASAAAHGLFGHIHVTGYAVENLPPGELREFFADPSVVDAALMGATFPDTGYALGDAVTRAYGEAAHWEPFIHAMVEHVIANYGPTYDTIEERRLIAFVLGMASHGMQDELFDSTFDHEANERDGAAEYDTIIDGFFNYDLHARMYPSGTYIPYSDLLPVYAADGQTVTQEIIQNQVDIVLRIYVNDGFGRDVSISYGESNQTRLPWTEAHYIDAAVPGSYRAEITPTGAYMQAIWDRLHGRYDDSKLVIHAWPEAPRRLRSSDHTSAASYVTVVFGTGVRYSSVQAALETADGQPHPFQLVNTRWGAAMTRVVQLRATSDYTPGGHYVARLESGMERIDGAITTAPYEVPFQVECATPDLAVCPDVGPIRDPAIDGSGYPLPRSSGDGGCGVAPTGRGSAVFAGLVALALAAVRLRRRAA